MLAVLQRQVRVIITLHGSDVLFSAVNRLISQIAVILAKYVVFSHKGLKSKIFCSKCKYSVVETGFDLSKFESIDKNVARKKFPNIPLNKNIVLFSSNFNRPEKNPKLAIEACLLVEDTYIVEFKGINRDDVKYLISAADVLLVTSLYETGPLVIKEALACNTPVISTNVGIAKELIANIDGCYIVDYDKYEIAEKLKLVFSRNTKISSRDKILIYDNNFVAEKIINIYDKLMI